METEIENDKEIPHYCENCNQYYHEVKEFEIFKFMTFFNPLGIESRKLNLCKKCAFILIFESMGYNFIHSVYSFPIVIVIHIYQLIHALIMKKGKMDSKDIDLKSQKKIKKLCPQCKKIVQNDNETCPNCGYYFEF